MKRIAYVLSKTVLATGILAVAICCKPTAHISFSPDTQWKFRTGNDLAWAEIGRASCRERV